MCGHLLKHSKRASVPAEIVPSIFLLCLPEKYENVSFSFHSILHRHIIETTFYLFL